MLQYNETSMGTVIVRQGDRKFNIDIRKGNCLAVLVHVRKLTEEERKDNPGARYLHTLYSFFGDEEHLQNMLNNQGDIIFDEVVSVKLNIFHEEARTLLKYFTKAGHKVTCFYKEGQ